PINEIIVLIYHFIMVSDSFFFWFIMEHLCQPPFYGLIDSLNHSLSLWVPRASMNDLHAHSQTQGFQQRICKFLSIVCLYSSWHSIVYEALLKCSYHLRSCFIAQLIRPKEPRIRVDYIENPRIFFVYFSVSS
ncbi:hypothetical protein ENBRE01_3478, partial [Enteropsectra breve]